MNARSLYRRLKRSKVLVTGRWYVTITFHADSLNLRTYRRAWVWRELYRRIADIDSVTKEAHLCRVDGRQVVHIAFRFGDDPAYPWRAAKKVARLVAFLRRETQEPRLRIEQ